jgi:hypothetical protein
VLEREIAKKKKQAAMEEAAAVKKAAKDHVAEKKKKQAQEAAEAKSVERAQTALRIAQAESAAMENVTERALRSRQMAGEREELVKEREREKESRRDEKESAKQKALLNREKRETQKLQKRKSLQDMARILAIHNSSVNPSHHSERSFNFNILIDPELLNGLHDGGNVTI